MRGKYRTRAVVCWQRRAAKSAFPAPGMLGPSADAKHGSSCTAIAFLPDPGYLGASQMTRSDCTVARANFELLPPGKAVAASRRFGIRPTTGMRVFAFPRHGTAPGNDASGC